jgi:hypothetical protein
MTTRTWAAVAALLGLVPASAAAQGFDYSVPGTRALGRGGAFVARGDDGTVAGTNPAALIEIPGYELELGSHLAFMDGCVTRSGSYSDNNAMDGSAAPTTTSAFGDPATWSNQAYPSVCRSGMPGPTPTLMFTGHPLPDFAFAVGVMAPAAVGSGTWGNPDGTIMANGQRLPSPTRYALIEENILLINPTIAVAWRPLQWLRIGAAFQPSIALVEFSNMAGGLNTTGDPGSDVRTKLQVNDWFVPAVVAAVHFVPIDELDIVLHGRISDAIDERGTLQVTTGSFGGPITASPVVTDIANVGLRSGQPWQLGLGFRYADRIHPRYADAEREGRRTGRVEDHMQNERWDVELDVTWQINSQVQDFILSIPANQNVGVCTNAAGCDPASVTPFPLTGAEAKQNPLPHGWQDQLVLRAGADWNILPGVLAARIGTSFNTSGFNRTYQTQDFMPGARLGLHIGGTWRIDRFDLSIAYAHIFQFNETVENGNFRGIAGMGTGGQCAGATVYDASQPVSTRGCYPSGFGGAVNSGVYTAEFNVVSVQGSYHF